MNKTIYKIRFHVIIVKSISLIPCVHSLILLECTTGNAYHSGAMFDDFPSSQVSTAKECLEKCNGDDRCKFWDFGGGWCRLRSSSGTGAQTDNGYTSGPRYCALSGTYNY